MSTKAIRSIAKLANVDVTKPERSVIALQFDRTLSVDRLVCFPCVFHKDIINDQVVVKPDRRTLTMHLDAKPVPLSHRLVGDRRRFRSIRFVSS